MSLGWTRAYEEAVKSSSFAPLTYEELARVAKASFGDAGDRYICPLERRAIRKARRKARSMGSTYIVHGRFGKPRRFKHRKSAVKCYLAFKASYGQAYITNVKLGISVKAPEPVHPGKLLDLRSLPVNVPVVLARVLNSDLFTSPKRLPPVTRQEVEMGPVIDHIPSENPSRRSGGLWAGQVSYVNKKFEMLKESIKNSDVVRAFSTLPPSEPLQKRVLMAIAGVYIAMAGIGVGIVSNSLTKIAVAAPLGR